jgi:hypothetical protein
LLTGSTALRFMTAGAPLAVEHIMNFADECSVNKEK